MTDTALIGAIRTDGGLLGYKSKMCATCTTAIYAGQKKFKSDKKIFCSDDCMQEYLDIKRVQSYRKQLLVQKSKNKNKITKDREQYLKEYDIKRKDRKRKYYLKHRAEILRDEKLKQYKREYYLKRKVEQLKANKDK